MNAATCKGPEDYTISPDGRSITFLPCGTTSYNANDVKHRYCGRCHRFVDDMELLKLLGPEG